MEIFLCLPSRHWLARCWRSTQLYSHVKGSFREACQMLLYLYLLLRKNLHPLSVPNKSLSFIVPKRVYCTLYTVEAKISRQSAKGCIYSVYVHFQYTIFTICVSIYASSLQWYLSSFHPSLGSETDVCPFNLFYSISYPLRILLILLFSSIVFSPSDPDLCWPHNWNVLPLTFQDSFVISSCWPVIRWSRALSFTAIQFLTKHRCQIHLNYLYFLAWFSS